MIERDRRYKLGTAGSRIEIDDAYIGGERTGEGAGRGRRGHTPFIIAVETSTEGRPLYARLQVVRGFQTGKTAMRAGRNAILYLVRTGCPLALSPARQLSAALDGLQHLPQGSSMTVSGSALGQAAYGVTRADGSGSQPVGGGSRQPIDQVGGKRGGTDNQVGYDAGNKVKGRKNPCLGPKGCQRVSSFIPPRIKTATQPVWCSTRSAAAP
jgi:hypothetical protein